MLGGQAADAAERPLMAVWAARAWVRGARDVVAGRGLGGGEQQLQAAKHRALAGMEQAEGAHAVQTA